MAHYSRPLNDNDLVRHFLDKALEHEYDDPTIYSIVGAEKGIMSPENESQTLTSTKVRGNKYLNDRDRWSLRKQIIIELTECKRLEKDDDIELGKGGALPLSNLESNKQAIIIIGLPASGKSYIASSIADEYGAIILDSDLAKRKIPEFKTPAYGAYVVHEESSEITFGFRSNRGSLKSVYEICLSKGHNVVIPKIGNSPKKILELARVLKDENKYDVHLISIELVKREATIRALKRFNDTGRYVPLGLIFDEYGNDTHLCYYYLRCKHSDVFKSFGALSNHVDIGCPPFRTDIVGDSPVSSYNENYNYILL